MSGMERGRDISCYCELTSGDTYKGIKNGFVSGHHCHCRVRYDPSHRVTRPIRVGAVYLQRR